MAHVVEASERSSSQGSIQEKPDIEKSRTSFSHTLTLSFDPSDRDLAAINVEDIVDDFDDPNIDKDAIVLGAWQRCVGVYR